MSLECDINTSSDIIVTASDLRLLSSKQKKKKKKKKTQSNKGGTLFTISAYRVLLSNIQLKGV